MIKSAFSGIIRMYEAGGRMDEEIYAGYDLQGGDEWLEFHTHRQLEIYQFIAGCCYFQIGSQFYELEPGDILLIDGMRLHKAFVKDEGEVYRRHVVHFTRESIQPLLASLDASQLLELFKEGQGSLYRMTKSSDKEIVAEKMRALAELTQLDSSYTFHEQQVKLQIVDLLMTLDRMDHQSIVEVSARQEEPLLRVQEIAYYLTQHYQEKLDLDKIASGVNLSKSYVSHLFREVTGMTVINFLMKYRLLQARYHLMMSDDLSIQEIALANGFESNAHFSRYFKQSVGVTPSQFRKANR
ncbi:AraC family transcriptional regulator [Aerococcus sanguinicola]|uniref:AraC family transcriptional regulator n=3 Tax=Aerococcus TaxID=1375 RepID=A0A2I1MSJ2_9LACT|nr:AraC family transcriptional regulator [Aerococcus sanguinicola]